MASVAESSSLVEDVVRLRRAERLPDAAAEVRPVRRNIEARLGPILSRSRAAHVLGVTQTAFDRWVAAGDIPIVIAPNGRREVPLRFVIELRESIDELRREGRQRPLAAALAKRRAAAEALTGEAFAPQGEVPSAPRGHRTAELRGRALHSLIAERLDEGMLEEALARVERLASEGRLHPRYAERWRRLLSGSPEEVAAAVTADSQDGRDLRQNSPFAGVLNDQERRRVIEGIR